MADQIEDTDAGSVSSSGSYATADELEDLQLRAALQKRGAIAEGDTAEAKEWQEVKELAQRKKLLAEINQDLPSSSFWWAVFLVIILVEVVLGLLILLGVV